MRRFIFAALLLVGAPAAAHAQRVPARDLLDFPLGTLADPVALAGTLGDGLWNPATIALPADVRARAGLAALVTGEQQGVGVQALAVAVAAPRATTLGIALLRASVRDLQRTDTDPQTLGDIDYSAMVVSATAARRWRRVTGGVAIRYRRGELDEHHRAVLGADAGFTGHLPALRDLRLGISSYLWRPDLDGGDRPALAAAGDVRLRGQSETRELRGGYSLVGTRDLGLDQYLHVGGRAGRFSLRAGLLRATAYDVVTWGSRLGVGLQHARYVVALSREERDTGLPPVYQFTLTSSFQ